MSQQVNGYSTHEILDALNEQICVLDSTGRIVYINRAWQTFGEENGSCCNSIGHNYLKITSNAIGKTSSEGSEDVCNGVKAVLEGRRKQFYLEYPCHSENEQRWFLMRVTPLPDSPASIVISHLNITERVLAEKNHAESMVLLNQYKHAMDLTNIVSKTDPSGIITYANQAFCDLSGYSKGELIGKTHNVIRHPDNHSAIFEDLWCTINSNRVWQGVLKNRNKQGDDYYVDSTIIPLSKHGIITEFMAIRHDITNIIAQERQLAKQTTDKLTGLPNREKLLEDIAKTDYPILAIININSFQEINNLFGVEFGDMVLKNLADILNTYINKTGLSLYKLPSDEYAVFANHSTDINDFETLMYEIENAIANDPFWIGKQELHVSVAIGLAHEKESILTHADMALKVARKQNKILQRYDKSLEEEKKYHINQKYIRVLKSALTDERIVAYYQPIVDNYTQEIVKYEALMRLIDDHGQIVSPFFFLNVAKKTRIYPRLTKKIVSDAMIFVSTHDKFVSINLSVEDIEDEHTREFIFEKLSESSHAEKICFEITESEGIENYTSVQCFIENIKTRGAKVSIDDFGSGYSNFMHLLNMNVDYIKIDGSIIKNIAQEKNSQIVAQTIMELAQRLNIEVIAEFVSDESIYQMVKSFGIQYSQGYHFGRPAPHDKINRIE